MLFEILWRQNIKFVALHMSFFKKHDYRSAYYTSASNSMWDMKEETLSDT